jgi:diguanylate cyclase (GGDEF)-like protein
VPQELGSGIDEDGVGSDAAASGDHCRPRARDRATAVSWHTSDDQRESSGSPDERLQGVGRLRERTWILVSAMLIVAGATGSVLAAVSESSSDAKAAHIAAMSSSLQIESALELATAHEADLIVDARAFVADEPRASAAQFATWAQSEHVLQRYPELLGLSHSILVPAPTLAVHTAAGDRDPADGPAADRAIGVSPAAGRVAHCQSVGSLERRAHDALPAASDWCAPGAARIASLDALDSGAVAYVATHAGAQTLLSIVAPVYRGNSPPSSEAGRRAAFLGWVGMAVNATALLQQAVAGHPGSAVTVQLRDSFPMATIRDGTIPRNAQSTVIHFRDGWSVRAFTAASATGIFASSAPTLVLLVGLVTSLLFGLVVFLLATGRAHARRQVTLKTGELRHQALHDRLTGLPNRELISDRVEQLLARTRRNRTVGGVLFIDLDGFKNVNDTLGHPAGDQLLRAVAERLTTLLRQVDTVGRLGGDEFIVLIDGDPYIAPELVAERILDVMRQPFQLDCVVAPIRITASVGGAIGMRGDASQLLRDADIALYRAKSTGRDHYEVFVAEMETTLRHQTEIGADLLRALDEHQYRLAYQPIYDLGGLTLVGFEALLRWDHPSLGVTRPDIFIPMLETSGRVVDVGRWVLETACQQMADWHALDDTIGISVNVSGRQLDSEIVVADVRHALEASHLKAGALTIEVTESSLLRNRATAARRLKQLKELSVNVAIDDFGTGYSSLAYLRDFPIDTIKIDRAFTDALERSPQSEALIRLLVQLGRDLGLRTLAEGVETIAQLDHLRDQHVDAVQGFLLSRPLTADAAAALIVRGPVGHLAELSR